MQIAAKPRHTSRLSRNLWLLGLLLVAVTIAAATSMVWDLRQEAIKNVRGEVNNLGIVIAEQTSRSLQAVDLVLRERDRQRSACVGGDHATTIQGFDGNRGDPLFPAATGQPICPRLMPSR
jgi:hypothetical protein